MVIATIVLSALATASFQPNVLPKAPTKVRTAKLYFQAKDTLITPGESVECELWLSFDPGVGELIPYGSYPTCLIGGFGFMYCDVVLEPANGLIGTWKQYQFNPAFSGASEFPGNFENMLYAIKAINLLPPPSASPYATKDNPLEILSFVWKPASYEDTDVIVDTHVFGKGPVIAADPFADPKAQPKLGINYSHWSVTPLVIHIRPQACFPDCDESGDLRIDDFICFQTLYAIGDPKADCDADGQLVIDDFICFQTAYAIGC